MRSKEHPTVTVSKVMSKCKMHCTTCTTFRQIHYIGAYVYIWKRLCIFQCAAFCHFGFGVMLCILQIYLVQSKRTHTLLLTSRGTSYNTLRHIRNLDVQVYRDFLINESLTVSHRASLYIFFFYNIHPHIDMNANLIEHAIRKDSRVHHVRGFGVCVRFETVMHIPFMSFKSILKY